MLAVGAYRAGPDTGSLLVSTHREGMAAKVGHDLVLEVTRWAAQLELAGEPGRSRVELTADPRSLRIREALRGLKPLSEADRGEIARNIDGKVLRGQPIALRSTTMRTAGEASLEIEGDLTIAGATRPVTVRLELPGDDRVTATVPLTQSAWGIKPYRGLMGALKVRDDVAVTVDARLAPG